LTWEKGRLPARAFILPALVALAALPAGCGGGAGLYDARATQKCLGARGLATSHADADFIARTAPNGSYLVTVSPTRVNVSFWQSHDDAEHELDAYGAFGAGDDALMYVKGNAVLAWEDTPTGEERSRVDGCLGS